jgi:periplasmic protein CpxP/Spy
MSKSAKMLLAGMAIAALSASVYASSEDGCGYGAHGRMMGWDAVRMEKYHEQHLARLHELLKLTPQQEPAWKKFSAVNPVPDASMRPNPAEMEKLNAPERLEKGLERMKLMEAKMTEHLAAVKEFYAVLTPEQQKVFDDQMPRPGWRGPRHGR